MLLESEPGTCSQWRSHSTITILSHQSKCNLQWLRCGYRLRQRGTQRKCIVRLKLTRTIPVCWRTIPTVEFTCDHLWVAYFAYLCQHAHVSDSLKVLLQIYPNLSRSNMPRDWSRLISRRCYQDLRKHSPRLSGTQLTTWLPSTYLCTPFFLIPGNMLIILIQGERSNVGWIDLRTDAHIFRRRAYL